jgi:hypothetical protein
LRAISFGFSSKRIRPEYFSHAKFETSQLQISHYLCQIRNAINKEFVPEFLGAHKGKKFFLKHNTESVRILHDFVDDDLAIIADGTYTRR